MPKEISTSFGFPITKPSEAVLALRPAFSKEIIDFQEAFVVIALDSKHCVIGKPYMAALGTVNGVMVSVRDVYREAIKRNAIGIIAAHNHPSGDLIASYEDIQLTLKLKKVGEYLGVTFLDHLIITKKSYLSIIDTKDLWLVEP